MFTHLQINLNLKIVYFKITISKERHSKNLRSEMLFFFNSWKIEKNLFFLKKLKQIILMLEYL